VTKDVLRRGENAEERSSAEKEKGVFRRENPLTAKKKFGGGRLSGEEKRVDKFFQGMDM